VTQRPFDAVLVVAFGGPEGMSDVRPFLANVLRGRRVAPERIEEVATHYEHFRGVSPLTAITRRQVEGLKMHLAARGLNLPVYLGMRNWHPLLPDTLKAMAKDGITQAIGFVCAPHRSYSSCTQYRENVADARRAALDVGLGDVSVTYVGDWHNHDLFIEANARHVRAAIDTLPSGLRSAARVVFTAHSIPVTMAGAARYRAQLMESARMVAERLDVLDWALVFQSRSGRPEDPWLEPDVCSYLRAERARGLAAVAICPIGFV
jgi:protoporphyrin/coproporphyrin ferrochelatase